MHCFTVSYKVREGHEEEAVECLRQLTAATRREAGCVLYLAHQAAEDARQFLIYEQYRGTADLEAHRGTEHYRRWAVEGLFRIAESRSSTVYVVLEPS